MSVISDPKLIALYRFKTLIVGLRLETQGLAIRGKSCYSILKQERGYTGNKVKVLSQAQADYEREYAALIP